jgi:hypothetical protein
MLASTAWLTTRRRVCPICKADVVRSLGRGHPSSSRDVVYEGDTDEEDWSPISVETRELYDGDISETSRASSPSRSVRDLSSHDAMRVEGHDLDLQRAGSAQDART